MRRVLLLPGYMGGGFGHISRCLTIAKALQKNGIQVAFVISGKHTQKIKDADFKLYSPRFPRQPKESDSFKPAYLYITDASYQVLRDGFTSPWRLKAALLELSLIIKKFKPDVLIGDLSLLTGIVGERFQIPVVQIIRSGMHPAAPQLVWWETPPSEIKPPGIIEIFNHILTKWKVAPLKTPEDLFRGDLYLIPSIPDIEPLHPLPANTFYVGPLHAELSPTRLVRPAEFGDSTNPVIYISIGGGASPVGNSSFFELLYKAAKMLPTRVVISTGGKVKELPPFHSNNITWVSWIDGDAAIFHSEVVMFHGGYGTTMEVVKYGKPSVIFPFHTEQESNGRRLALLNVAKVLTPVDRKKYLKVAIRRWKGGEFTIAYQEDFGITPEDISKALMEVYTNSDYRKRAEALKITLKKYSGVNGVVELIQKKFL